MAMPLRQHNKGQFQDILTKLVKFQDNNFRTSVKFQEFQENWEPCIRDPASMRTLELDLRLVFETWL